MASIGSQFAPHVALERTASAIASARRAVLADRYAISSFAVEWRWLAELLPVADDWRDLAGRAIESNIFYDPGFALAAASVFGNDVGAVLVWSGTTPRRAARILSGAHQRTALRTEASRPRRLDASLRPARNAAGRTRGGGAGDRRLAGLHGRRSVAPRTSPAAARRRGRAVCSRTRRDFAANANAGRRFCAASPRFAGAAAGSHAVP